jgi:hypothetical protein
LHYLYKRHTFDILTAGCCEYSNEGEIGGAEAYRIKEDNAWEALRSRFSTNEWSKLTTSEQSKTPEAIAHDKAKKAHRKFMLNNVEDSWIVFDPKQIKSATGNNGNFDPNDPDITH